jgi:hypothetical protein
VIRRLLWGVGIVVIAVVGFLLAHPPVFNTLNVPQCAVYCHQIGPSSVNIW